MFTLAVMIGGGLLGSPASAHADSRFMAAIAAHATIPAWARKYNMSCSGCHFPAVPQLNATGLQFKWAGYRMPEELGEKVDAEQVSHYLATRLGFRYAYSKPTTGPATENRFDLATASIFYGGAFGKRFGAFFEVAKEDENTEFGGQVVAVFGGERAHAGFRAGKTHLIVGDGLAGFDRPLGITMPTPLSLSVTSSIPFAFAGDQAGVEGFYVIGPNRASLKVLDGIALEGDDASILNRRKAVVLTDQLLLDAKGSGLIATGYFGSARGLDPDDASRHGNFWRLAVSANKYVANFGLLGGLVLGRDYNLPLSPATPFVTSTTRGYGYWFAGEYIVPNPSLILFSRYEYVDPDRSMASDANTRIVAGGVLPLNLPEYLRLTAEFWRDLPQDPGLPDQNNVALEVLLSF